MKKTITAALALVLLSGTAGAECYDPRYQSSDVCKQTGPGRAGIFGGTMATNEATPPTKQEPPAHMRERIANQPSEEQLHAFERARLARIARQRAEETEATVSQDEIDRCLKWIGIARQYKDPQSLRLDLKPTATVNKAGAKTISMAINAKNSYGAYAGMKYDTCHLTPDGRIDVLADLQ